MLRSTKTPRGPSPRQSSGKETDLLSSRLCENATVFSQNRPNINHGLYGPALPLLAAEDFHRIPDRKSAALDDLGVHTEFHMPVERAKLRNRIRIALRCLRVHLGRGTARRA